jgi:hypothetical protein
LILRLADRVDALTGATPTIRMIQGDNQSGAPGAHVGQPLIVEVRSAGSPAPDQAVVFEAGGGGKVGRTTADLGASLTLQTGANGQAELPVWVLGPSGPQTVVARLDRPDGAGVTFRASLTPLTLAIIGGGDPQTASSGGLVPDALVVEVTRGESPVGGVTVRFEVRTGGGKIASEGPAVSSSVDVETNDDGTATVETWSLGAPGPQSVVATVAGASPESVTFTATAT